MVVDNGDYEHETGFSLNANSLCDAPIIAILPVQNFFPSSVELVHLHSAIFRGVGHIYQNFQGKAY